MMKYLQKLGKALMLPVAVLPICGILMGLGYALAPGVMGVPGAATSGAAYTVGFLLVKAGGALIDNMAWLFAIGAAVGLADNDGTAGLAGLVSFLMMQQLLNPGVVGMVRHLEEGTATYIAFQKVAGNSFIGILAAVVGAACYNKFKDIQLPDWLAFFSGKRFVAIATGLISILVSVVLLFVWPVIFDALVAIGNGIAGMGGIGAGIYAFLNRLLIPTGLHHLIYMPFQFSSLGGSLTVGSVTYTGAYAVCMTEYTMGLPLSDGIVWMYTGFTKTFGYLGIAAAFIFTARRENRARTAAAMIPLAVTASVASITEPIDFLFCFVSPLLWVAHAVITGGFMVLLHVLHVRAFTSNLLGSLVFNLSAGEQLQNLPLLYLLGLAEILTYFAVFSILIKAKDLPTPGREAAPSTDQSPYADPQEVCRFIAALGGPENIAQLGNCFTRLRLTVRDASLLDMGALLSLPHKGLVVQGTRVQLVCGLHAAQLRRALEQQLAEMAPV